MPGIQVDGNDILAVYVAAEEAVDRARAGEGPTMLECVTYRLSLHTTADDPTQYRDEEEVERWERREPIPRFRQYLKDKGLLTEEEIESLESEIEDQIEEAIDAYEDRAEELQGEPETMFDHVYAERPPYLEAQRERFVRSREVSEEEADA
jgi:TPP-dependent pyruvate/acetoin dehydrogenase alpha subunit